LSGKVGGARDAVLARITGALADRPIAPEVPRAYRLGGDLEPGHPELVELLVDRLVDYRATVIRAGDDVVAAIEQVLPEAPVRHAPGLPEDWLPAGSEPDSPAVDPRDLDSVGAVVTGSVVAVAETGSIVLDHSPLCGRRALTLVPDMHVCVVRHRDVVATVPEALRRVDPTGPLTFISGPSATSDIELTRVEGVHGPRTLVVVLVEGG